MLAPSSPRPNTLAPSLMTENNGFPGQINQNCGFFNKCFVFRNKYAVRGNAVVFRNTKFISQTRAQSTTASASDYATLFDTGNGQDPDPNVCVNVGDEGYRATAARPQREPR